jgi:hypothetical protein
VRRLGILPVPENGWEQWSEQVIEEKGEIDPLSEIVQSYIRWFIELPIISGSILACVILMSLFIFVDIVSSIREVRLWIVM